MLNRITELAFYLLVIIACVASSIGLIHWIISMITTKPCY